MTSAMSCVVGRGQDQSGTLEKCTLHEHQKDCKIAVGS